VLVVLQQAKFEILRPRFDIEMKGPLLFDGTGFLRLVKKIPYDKLGAFFLFFI
jgi:hypothetical protein